MQNKRIRELIVQAEQQIEYLKKDYEDLEKYEKQDYRKECVLDIINLRRTIYTVTQKIKDLNWVKKNV